MKYHKLIFNAIAPGQITKSAIISLVRPREVGRYVHYHDFFEMMYVLDGAMEHLINGSLQKVSVGDLLFIRPDDCHDVGLAPDKEVHFFNISFRADVWTEYCKMVELDPLAPGKTDPDLGSLVSIPETDRPACTLFFQESLYLLNENPTRLNLCRFWANMLPWLQQTQDNPAGQGKTQRAWLTNACRAMHDWQNLSGGVPRFIEISGVTAEHLSRVLKSTTGQSPTEYINAMRLQRAASLLATTGQDIAGIALDSGFENLSYFYRLFHAHYGKTPRSYRLGLRQRVEPEKIDRAI